MTNKPTCHQPRPALKSDVVAELNRLETKSVRMQQIKRETTRLQDERIDLGKLPWQMEYGHRLCSLTNRIAELDVEYLNLKGNE